MVGRSRGIGGGSAVLRSGFADPEDCGLNRRFRLAGRAARRVVFRYIDRNSGRRMVDDSVVCVTHGREAEYLLYLRTPAEDYAKDRVIFEAMVRSFRGTPGSMDRLR